MLTGCLRLSLPEDKAQLGCSAGLQSCAFEVFYHVENSWLERWPFAAIREPIAVLTTGISTDMDARNAAKRLYFQCCDVLP